MPVSLNFLRNPRTTNILTKVVGGSAAALCLYSSHVYGKIKASENAKEHKADTITERYLDDMKLDSPSITKMKAKEGIFRYFVDEDLSGFFKSIGGYGKGFATMAVSNVIPLGLAAGTFIGSQGIKGKVSKFCGAGLLAYGGIFLLQEIFGIGKHH